LDGRRRRRQIAEFQAAGLDEFLLAGTAPEHTLQMERFAREVVPLAKKRLIGHPEMGDCAPGAKTDEIRCSNICY
jgi:hypothetical protein